ncbi:MAG: hypothetical protein MJ110_06635, partial [Lachnospiraceae bacterium]|nr:hypothetical protein [Lachnospiraceae bacterium]
MSQYTNVLKRMADLFTEESIPAILKTKEQEKDLPMDLLSVLLDDYSEKGNEWLAEFCFLPLQNGAEETAYLSVAITITEELTPVESDMVAFFISRFNHYVPFGAFSVSEDGTTLAYKLCTPVFDRGNEDELFDSFNLVAGHALDFVDNFGSLLESIIDGDVTPEEALIGFFHG